MEYERVDQHVRLAGDDGVTVIRDGPYIVCTCIEGPGDEYLRLILAAPDLLEALKAALPYIERMYDESAPVLPMVRGAIEKAEGGKA